MKQELTAFIWPALVGVLAAALILDKWVLEPQKTGTRRSTAGTVMRGAGHPRWSTSTPPNWLIARTDPPELTAAACLFSNRGSRQRIERSLGSGVILSAAGHIVTNNHVIAGADAIQVLLADGRSANASVVGSDPETDLAILHIDLPALTPIALADAEDIAVGDVVLAIGNPYGLVTLYRGHRLGSGPLRFAVVDLRGLYPDRCHHPSG